MLLIRCPHNFADQSKIRPIKPHVDIILPLYNPAPDWSQVVMEQFEKLRDAIPDIALRMILVNDGSTQAVEAKHVESIMAKWPETQYISYIENRGKGYAVRRGVEVSEAPYMVFTDIDFPYTTRSMQRMIEALITERADVLIGVRNASYYAQLPWSRRVISRFLRALNKAFLRLVTSDTQGGLKAFNLKGRSIFLQTTIDRYLFDLEYVYLASRNASVEILPMEVDLRENVEMSGVKLPILVAEGWNFIRVIFR